jgi:hypothetical protein
MKKLACVVSILLCVGCNVYDPVEDQLRVEDVKTGTLSVSVEYESLKTKATTEYTAELDEEKLVRDVTVLVFDKLTGNLNAYRKVNSFSDELNFTVNAGEKIVYALVNGPDVGQARNIYQMMQNVDDLRNCEIGEDGLAMFGNTECVVSSAKVAKPVVVVRRLASRVVVKKITNRLPPQYGSMTVNCVYLGNANLSQTLSGSVSGMVNPNGYEDQEKSRPIGKDGYVGTCRSYLYRNSNVEISSGASSDAKYHMYCQPNTSNDVTCLYVLVTIANIQYYYRVPLHKGLAANTTNSVELEIVNLGSPLPPDGDMQRGDIMATVSVAGWDAGEKYQVEF